MIIVRYIINIKPQNIYFLKVLTFGVRIPATYGVAIPDKQQIPLASAIIVGA